VTADQVASLFTGPDGVIRAGYDPVLPVAAADSAHAYRLAARVAA